MRLNFSYRYKIRDLGKLVPVGFQRLDPRTVLPKQRTRFISAASVRPSRAVTVTMPSRTTNSPESVFPFASLKLRAFAVDWERLSSVNWPPFSLILPLACSANSPPRYQTSDFSLIILWVTSQTARLLLRIEFTFFRDATNVAISISFGLLVRFKVIADEVTLAHSAGAAREPGSQTDDRDNFLQVWRVRITTVRISGSVERHGDSVLTFTLTSIPSSSSKSPQMPTMPKTSSLTLNLVAWAPHFDAGGVAAQPCSARPGRRAPSPSLCEGSVSVDTSVPPRFSSFQER